MVDKVHSFTSHGDPYIRTFAHNLLHKITRPWYEMLKTWIYAGRLVDPFQEFFVFKTTTRPAQTGAKNGGGGGSAWETRYSLRRELVPGFLGEGVVRKVFLIGKSLNFIREDCGEEGYILPQSEGGDREMQGIPHCTPLLRCVLVMDGIDE